MLRLLFKLFDPAVTVRDNDAEPACFLHWNRHGGDRHIRLVRFMEIEHHFIIHLIDMVS